MMKRREIQKAFKKFSLCFRGKNKVHPFKGETGADDSKSVSAPKDPVSANPPEAGKQEKTPFFKRLFGRFLRKKPDSTWDKPEESKKRKTGGLFQLFNCCTTPSPAEPPVDHYGFPNIGLTCYMNSSLQSLLTLRHFVRDISLQEEVWTSVPQAELLRHFMAIRDAHTSTDAERKRRLLRSFKEAVWVQEPGFRDDQQEDAHEFLTSVLNQIRGLSPQLQDEAARLGQGYSCPVEKHLVFKMESIRTCKSCGVQSRRTEEFTNLSVDLLPGGSVEEMMEDYQTETELEFRCECGGNLSGMRTEFKTLPKVLILHLKRFCYSPSFEQMKVKDPVELLRDLVVSSEQETSCYSLVSMISHYGSSEAGHYICDSVHPDQDPDKSTDRWLTFNDKYVFETTGRSVCAQRQRAANILFYKRHQGPVFQR